MRIEELDRSEKEKEKFVEFCEYLGFLILQGKNGTGKTEVAKAIYQRFTPYILPAYDHDKAIFITQAALNNAFIEGFEKWGPVQTINYFKSPKMLVIDDLGSRTPTDAFRDFLLDIVDSRFNNRSFQGTVITTNKQPGEIQNLFGSDIFSRITSGTCLIIDGDDRRKTHRTLEQQPNDMRKRIKAMCALYPNWRLLGENVYIQFEKNGYKYSSPPIKVGSDECEKLLSDAENITRNTICQPSSL